MSHGKTCLSSVRQVNAQEFAFKLYLSLPLGPFSGCTRGQTTQRMDKSSPGTLFRVHQGVEQENKRESDRTVGAGWLWDDVQSTRFYCSQGLDPSTLSFLQTSSVFYTLHWLDSDIRGVVVFLLKVPIRVSLNPAGWSFVEHFSHMGTESIV